MGTRSLTYVLDEENRTLCEIYRQMDGYPEGQGKDLYDILQGRSLVEGFQMEHRKMERYPFNGMGCLAASLVAGLKTGIGSIYMCPSTPIDTLPAEMDRNYAEWAYVIYPGKGKHRNTIRVLVYEGSKKRFDGTVDKMGKKFGFLPALPVSEAVGEPAQPVQ